ncbi:hypothetical protein NCCP2222_09000 [Sporosarcina sp. NCCP-2222]|uniref:hypothetical protein n=1 Tax=Sporosarcina sp. NCCP-2222 TaxID=2935073 RepID=UPI0020838430|nr:hypothetical protein [Sporosarcina sp. NCCP-2222]GKV54953.1 hypothetical protein NCCP2222_09000 [Sporosarcina sp. NCCP-2222]
MGIQKITKDQALQAVKFMKEKARPLEKALYEFDFEDGSPDKVLEELHAFQNEDGGFGNGLEPDFRCEASSALATTIGLHHLSHIGADDSNQMVERAVHYMLQTFDEQQMGWEIVPKEVETAPRAIWWNYGGDWPWGNPSADVIGLLHHYRKLVPDDLLHKLTAFAVDYVCQLTASDHHEIQCIVRMMDALPETEANRIAGKVNELLIANVTTNPDKWSGYCLLPLQIVTSPESPFAELFKDSIPANIEHLLSTQDEDGSWKPAWAWGQFEEEFQQAKMEWSGVLTLDHIRVLHAFGILGS